MGRLYRSSNRVVAGVCAGLAEEFGINVRTFRLIVVILLFVSCGAVALAYFLLMFLPVKGNQKSYAERMKERLGNK